MFWTAQFAFILFEWIFLNLYSLLAHLWRWWKIRGNLFWIIFYFLHSTIALLQQQNPTLLQELAPARVAVAACVRVSLQCRHLCFPACFPQYITLWCALISCYTLGAIVLFCCKLIHVPLTVFPAPFNTPNGTGDSFSSTCSTLFPLKLLDSRTHSAVEAAAGSCWMWPCIHKARRSWTLWYSITLFMYTGGLWADCGQPEMKAAADFLIWWLLPWQLDRDWGGAGAHRERERTENYLSHTPMRTAISLSLALFCPLSFTNTRTPPPPPTSSTSVRSEKVFLWISDL